MKRDDVEVGETYLFIGSDSPKRKHLAGQAFTVVSKDQVYRKVSYRHKKRSMKVIRFFNDDGIGARAEELGALPKDFTRCRNCGCWSNLAEIKPEVEKGPINCPECGESIAIRVTMQISKEICLPPVYGGDDVLTYETDKEPDAREFPCVETYMCTECGHTATFP
jgi:predicted RNA-binding Zn-ribbon protein involved in translation (DUF1610 family)